MHSVCIHLWLPVNTNASLFQMAVSALPYYSVWWIQGQVWSHHIIVYGGFKVMFEIKVRSLCFFSSTILRLLPINLKKVKKWTTGGGRGRGRWFEGGQRLLISSQRLWSGFAHKTPGFFSDLLRLCLSHWTVYHFIGGKEKQSVSMRRAMLYHSVTLFKYQASI